MTPTMESQLSARAAGDAGLGFRRFGPRFGIAVAVTLVSLPFWHIAVVPIVVALCLPVSWRGVVRLLLFAYAVLCLGFLMLAGIPAAIVAALLPVPPGPGPLDAMYAALFGVHEPVDSPTDAQDPTDLTSDLDEDKDVGERDPFGEVSPAEAMANENAWIRGGSKARHWYDMVWGDELDGTL